MIDVENLTKYYGNLLAVDNISFHVDKGMVVGFLGPNGAGKSTTLRILTCAQPATSGSARIDGRDVLSESLEVRRRVGYMPEAVPIYPEMRVGEYLAFRASLREIPPPKRKSAIDRVAEQCRLSSPEDMMRRRVGELSRGYRQRVGLAEVLLHDPPVLVLDEPTLGLDPAQIRSMREMIQHLGAERTVLLSSHILAEVEQTCNHLVIIAGGRIAATGTPAELREKVASPSRVVAEVKGAEAGAIETAVKKLHEVRTVSSGMHGQWVRLEIEAKGQADIRAELMKLVVEQGWSLRELRRATGSLEDFFVQITYQQNINRGQQLAAAV
jgi:ABC-2 type transport system ATP-binding protein